MDIIAEIAYLANLDLSITERLMGAYQLPDTGDNDESTQDAWDLCEYLCSHAQDREAQLYA